MSDKYFDPCECIFGQELEMRRLLSLLRQSQSQCTDTECFTAPSQEQTVPSDYYIVMSIMIVVYFVMHYWMQNYRNRGDAKLNGNGNGLPPTPPPTSS